MFELKKGEVPEIILNRLFKDSQMQDSFGINMVALVNNVPKLMNLKELLKYLLLIEEKLLRVERNLILKKLNLDVIH